MVDVVTGLRLGGGLVLLLSNGFFVATEFALTRIRQFSKDEFRGGSLKRPWEMTERLEIYLSGCQVGITISSVGLGVVAEPVVAAVLDPLVRAVGIGTVGAAGHTALSVILALSIINLLHLIVGEQAPTYLGIERTKFVARYGAPLLYWWTKLMAPVIVTADWVAKGLLGIFGIDITRSWAEGEREGEAPSTRRELRREMGEALQSAGVTDERRQEIINALEIGDIPVEGIMTGRDDIVALSTTDDLTTNLQRIRDSQYVRFPLVGDELEEFHGTVYTPAIFGELDEFRAGNLELETVATAPVTVTADMAVSELIDRFQTENQELALVVEDGDVIGLVTATDAFEEITGELRDPLDVRTFGK